jgi:hypothetical protein
MNALRSHLLQRLPDECGIERGGGGQGGSRLPIRLGVGAPGHHVTKSSSRAGEEVGVKKGAPGERSRGVGFESGRRIFLAAALVTVVGSQRLVPGSKHGGRGTVRAGPLRVNAHGPTTYVSRRAHRIYGPKRRPYIRIFKTLLAAQILTFCRSTVNEPEINGPFLDQLQTLQTFSNSNFAPLGSRP